MKNIIKAEFIRMAKSKAAWILLIITLGVVFLSVASFALVSLTFEELFSAGPEVPDEFAEMFLISDFEQLFTKVYNSNTFILILVIMAVLFASRPYKTGFIKTIIGTVTPKYRLIIPEYICMFTYSVILSFVSGQAIFAFGCLMFNDFISLLTIESLFTILAFVLVQSVMLGCFSCIIVGITNLVKSTAMPLVMSLLYVTTLGGVVYQIISDLLAEFHVVSTSFSLIDYTLLGNIYSMTIDSMPEDIIKVAILCILFTTLSTFVTSAVLEKQDIR